MEREDVKKYIDKKVRIFLKTRYVYNGSVVSVGSSTLDIFDKFGVVVTIALDDISLIEERNNNYER